MSHIDTTLEERGTRYGDFVGHADITQGLKNVMEAAPNWKRLANDQKEALEMTAHKIGRILNGDPDYLDSWHDIIGYIRLVEQRLELRAKAKAMANDVLGTPTPAAKQTPVMSIGEAMQAMRAGTLPDSIHIVVIEEDTGEI